MTEPSSYEPPPAYAPAPPQPAADYPYPDNPPPPPPPYPGYPPVPPVPYAGPPTNTLAIASLVSAFVCMPLGVVFGHISLAQIKRTGEQGRGLAIAGLVIGYLLSAAAVVMLVLTLLLVRVAQDAMHDGVGSLRSYVPPASGERVLPPFLPPAGLGSSCSYPATPTAAAKPVTPPTPGSVPTGPAAAVTLMTNDGALGISLDIGQAPCTVNSFTSLARQGYFDQTPCHRLTAEPAMSVLQCGDPTGTGAGGPGYRFDNEYPTNQYRRMDPALDLPVLYPRGTVAMANAGPDSNGSQFFLIYRDSMLPPTYTVFGQVDDADLPVLDRLVAVGVRDGADDGPPATPITISSVQLK